jgi:hypothetical protein
MLHLSITKSLGRSMVAEAHERAMKSIARDDMGKVNKTADCVSAE